MRLKVLKMFKFFKFFKFFKLSKYRIVQENDKFYPEERFALFFWSRFYIWCDKILFFKEANFKTLQEAKTFLKKQQIKKQQIKESKRKIHKF